MPAQPSPPVLLPDAKIALATGSVFPEGTSAAFEVAAQLGYDGVEVMVWNDPISQDVDALERLRDDCGLPVLAVHAPCLALTQRVWGTDPWGKLRRAADAAQRLGASTVVVHPPFRWQRDYGRTFESGLAALADSTGVVFAVENMFPLRARGREVSPYTPDWDPSAGDFAAFTLDVSHASVSGSDLMTMAARMGSRLRHVHLGDGSGSSRDEHLVPGRGDQPCDVLLETLAAQKFDGLVVVEINTRRADDRHERETDVAEALAFARLHLAAPLTANSAVARPATEV